VRDEIGARVAADPQVETMGLDREASPRLTGSDAVRDEIGARVAANPQVETVGLDREASPRLTVGGASRQS
jgi:hypothetical protein